MHKQVKVFENHRSKQKEIPKYYLGREKKKIKKNIQGFSQDNRPSERKIWEEFFRMFTFCRSDYFALLPILLSNGSKIKQNQPTIEVYILPKGDHKLQNKDKR